MPDPTSYRRRWISLYIVLSAAFMQLIDITIVNVAIPSIQRDLHAKYSEIVLIVSLYQLGFAVLLITGGRLGDIYGRKRVFLLGMLGFIVSSGACGFAPSAGVLVASRLVQGLFAALMYPQVLAVIQVSFPAQERARAFGTLGAITGVATVAGPLFGGVLIQWNLLGLEWRPIFLINVVIGAVALAVARKYLSESKAEYQQKLDLPGVLLAAAALFALIWPLATGREAGWPLWAWASLAAAIPLGYGFVRHEKRRTGRSQFPLFNMNLLENRSFKTGLLVSLFFFMGVPAFSFVFMLYLQIGLHYSPLNAGLTLVPFAVFSASGSASSIRLLPRLGKKLLYLGTVLLSLGMGGVILAVRSASISISSWDVAAPLAIAGAGLGTTVAPLINIVLAGIQAEEAGSASGVLTTSQRVGGSVGIGIIGVIFFALLAAYAKPAAQRLVPATKRELQAAGVPAVRAREMADHFEDCFLRRMRSPNPTTAPPGCSDQGDVPDSQGPARILSSAARRAIALDFTRAVQWTFLFQIAVFGTVLVLLVRLPEPPREVLGGDGRAGA